MSGVPTMWLKTGTLQGQIYEQLFVAPFNPNRVLGVDFLADTVRPL